MVVSSQILRTRMLRMAAQLQVGWAEAVKKTRLEEPPRKAAAAKIGRPTKMGTTLITL
jgi:hypothetical protein